MGNQTSKHLKSFVKTTDGEVQALCNRRQDDVLKSGGHCFSTLEDLEESCTDEERAQTSVPEVVCAICFRLGGLIPLRRSLQQGSVVLQLSTK